MLIKNTREYQAIFETVLRGVIEDVSDWLLDKLVQQIKKDVYGKVPNKWYTKGSGKPTFEFLNAWEWTKLKKTSNQFIRELYFNRSTLVSDPNGWIHRSNVYGWGSSVEYIEKILNVSGFTSSLEMFHVPSAIRKPYWDNFIEKWITSGKLDKEIQKRLQRAFGSGTTVTMTGKVGGF